MRASAFVALTIATTLAAAQTCSNYGTASLDASSSCACPAGFTADPTCVRAACGGSLYDPGLLASIGSGGVANLTLGNGCECSDGWKGPACTVCTSSSACQKSLSRFSALTNPASSSSALNNTVTCSTIPSVYSTSHMSCSVVQQTLQALFPLDSTLTISRVLDTGLSPGGNATTVEAGLVTGGAEIWAQLWYDGVEQFYCQADQCIQEQQVLQAGNSSLWTCRNLKCTCIPGTNFCGATSSASPSTNLTSTINSLSGTLIIDCAPEGTCAFKQSLLQTLFGANGLQLSSCSFGECVQQSIIDQALGIATVSTASAGLSAGVIAGLAVVGAILVAIIAVVIWGLIVRRKARRTGLKGGNLEKPLGVGVEWRDVSYEVRNVGAVATGRMVYWLKGVRTRRDVEGGKGKGEKVVLEGVSGGLGVGGFCAVLGPSGAGKSTFVDILAGKRKSGKTTGVVTYLNSDGHRSSTPPKIGYVDQSDVLSPTSTVLETLIFAARLRLPESLPDSVKIARAEEVMAQLGLSEIADTRIGSGEHRGVSGGEMRRVSIGVELVGGPEMLVLDEPTSGLDSVSAARLVKLLGELSRSPISRTTIIASIHQPSSALYQSFDSVLLLAGGKQLYFGRGGSTPVEHFASQGRPCPEGYNVADHLLEIASGPIDGLTTNLYNPSRSDSGSHSEEKCPAHLATHHNEYPPNYHLTQQTPPKQTTRSKIAPGHPQHCATTFLTQVEVLGGREWRNLKRDKTLLVAHVGLACLLGVFAGGLYYQVDITIAGFQNRVGSMFFLGSLIAFSSLSALYNLVEVRPLFLRERAGSFYSPTAWLLTRVLFDVVPLRLLPTILVSTIVYFMVGLSLDAARFFKFLLILVEFSLGMTLFNFLLATIYRNGGIAILLSSLANLFLMTYAGFFVNIGQIPPVLRWLRYFSTLGYALEALSVNEVASGLLIRDTLAGVPVEINATIIMETLFGFDLGNYYRDVLVLFAFIVGFAVLLVGVVVYRLRENR